MESTTAKPLPPIGSPLEDVAGPALDVCARLKRECMDVRDDFIGWADLGRQYYHYGAPEPPDEGVIVANDIQNFIITQTDIQTKEPPTISLEAVDTEEPPTYFHNLTPQQAAAAGLQPQEFQPTMGPNGQPQPPQPLSPQSVANLQQLIMAGMLPPTALIQLTVTETVDFFQKIFDVVWWNRSSPDEWYWDNTLLTNVDGWCPPLFEFDDEKKRVILTNCPLRQFFCDPTSYDVERWGWFIADIPYRLDVAQALFPDYADELAANATPTGKLERPPNTLEMGSQYEDVSAFQTPMVTLTVMFLRDQDCMMTPEDAVEGGHLQKRTINTGNWMPAPTADDPNAIQQQQRTALFHPDTDEEVVPPGEEGHEPARWPTYKCTRHLTMIQTRQVLLGDEESAYWDFPCALNMNIPILGKPFGIGEPFRLRPMQDARTRSLTAIADHVENFKTPWTWSPKSARELMPEEFKDAPATGAHFWIDDETVTKTNGKPMGVMDPPALPDSHLKADDKFKREMNDSGGNMAAIQGQPSEQISQLSGVAIAQLQAGASSLSSFKARRIQAVIRRLAHLTFHAILTRMNTADFKKIIKRYPDHVLDWLHAQAQELEWSVKVTVSAGTGATLQQKKAEAKDNQARGLQSRTTTQETLGLDPTLEDQRMGQEMAQQARITMQNQPAAPGHGQPAGAGGRV